jgi:hypothetical protein
MVAAAVLMALVRADAVRLTIGDKGFGDPTIGWLMVLLSGFVAGFSERFVPDLLAKVGASTEVPSRRGEEPGAAAAQRKEDGAAEPPKDQAAGGESSGGGEMGDEEDPHPEDAATDACAADIEVTDEIATADADLPPAAGGVAKPETGGGAG